MPLRWTKTTMLIIAICFLVGAALLAWGLRLAFYKHPADYTEGEVVITHEAASTPGSEASSSPTSTPTPDPSSEPAEGEEDTVTVEGQTFHVDLADTMEKRAQGLSGREPLGEKEGMLFLFPSAGSYGFWMKDMKFDIDIVWIKGSAVVGVTANVPAPKEDASMFTLPSYYPPEPVDKVLELNAGAAAKYGINAGDTVSLEAER